MRAEPGETPRGSGVIEMDVAEKNVPNVLSGESRLLQLFGQVLEGRLRSGVEERQTILSFKRSRGDNPGPVELSGIENVNRHRTVEFRPKALREKAVSYEA